MSKHSEQSPVSNMSMYPTLSGILASCAALTVFCVPFWL